MALKILLGVGLYLLIVVAIVGFFIAASPRRDARLKKRKED